MLLRFLVLSALFTPYVALAEPLKLHHRDTTNSSDHYTVLILGGGISGIIAARTLHDAGVDDFLLIEASSELGGRLHNFPLGNTTVEVGAQWIQGTQMDSGPKNPILTLVEKWNVSTSEAGYTNFSTYDSSGQVDYQSDIDTAVTNIADLYALAGERQRAGLVDISARTGYSLVGAVPQTPHQMAAEYIMWDWEYAVPPEQSSLIASALNNNNTYDAASGGFAGPDRISVDQRGFKTFIQSEAASFMTSGQMLINSPVENITYSAKNASVTLRDGRVISADYVLCTFSAGVLQHNEVTFEPALPAWKQEAINSITMSSFTEIFMRFASNFWFDTDFALYADPVRGTYPIFQSYDRPNLFPNSSILSVTVTGSQSKRANVIPSAVLQSEIVNVLKSMFPNANVSDPEDVVYYPWDTDPLFRGAYSSWPPSFTAVHQQNLRANVNGSLWFAGEATSAKYNGFMQGAYFEGEGIAMEILKCIKSNASCAGLPHTELALATNATF